ncbi:hypothetical protein K440DRAFT_416561 [Wilcoxina mikolae CBS 423.85]|nr:hypothetical protein K440DRAFT_416561 [Wilcoxina mikolae CBS 423.85]
MLTVVILHIRADHHEFRHIELTNHASLFYCGCVFYETRVNRVFLSASGKPRRKYLEVPAWSIIVAALSSSVAGKKCGEGEACCSPAIRCCGTMQHRPTAQKRQPLSHTSSPLRCPAPCCFCLHTPTPHLTLTSPAMDRPSTPKGEKEKNINNPPWSSKRFPRPSFVIQDSTFRRPGLTLRSWPTAWFSSQNNDGQHMALWLVATN